MRLKIVSTVITLMLTGAMSAAQITNSATNTKLLGTGPVVSFDFPGASNTQATAITPSGDIVGRFTGTDGIQHGFLVSAGKFKSITFPGATLTDVNWINPRGAIVGGYIGNSGGEHGFLLNNGKFTTIDYPNAGFTVAFGVGATGEVVGIYGDENGMLHGFLWKAGTFSVLDVTGASGSLPAMISAGHIVGGYFNSTGLHGFSSTLGVVQTIDCPGATFTFLSGLAPQGHMVGGYATVDGNGHGALVTGGNCIAIDFPGGTNTYANGINPQGDIVGRYTGADGTVHGFLWRGFVKTASMVYSAAHDFSTRLNPNAVWSYGFTTTVGGPFTLNSISGSTYYSGEAGWFGPIPGATAPGFPLVVGGANVISTVLDMGPGPSSYAVVRWTAPSRGRWDVVGEFFGTGLTTGDVHVLRDGAPVFNSAVNGSQVAQFSLSIDVVAGDTIDFAVGPGPYGDNLNDPTGFNVTITPEQ